MKISQENFANHHGEISPPELYQVLRAKFGQPCGILESMSFDESNKMSLLVANPRQKITPTKDVFAELKKALEKCSALPTEEDFPFAGGLIGWLNYETVQEVEPILQSKFSQEKNKPLATFSDGNSFDQSFQSRKSFQSDKSFQPNPSFQPKNKEEAIWKTAEIQHEFKTGDKVSHTEFGEGTVIIINGDLLKIAFNGKGMQTVNISITTLDKIS